MASVNKVIIVGNLGRDPEVRYTPSGSAVCNISVATTRSWKDKTTGDKVEEAEWHRIVFFDKLAEIAGEYLKKGRPVYVEGRLKTRKYTDKDGIERYSTEIVAEQMQLLGSRDDARSSDDGSGGQGGYDGDDTQASAQASRPQQRPAQASAPQRQAPANAPQRPAPTSGPQRGAPQRPAPRQPAGGFDDMDDDIPF